ncbi:MAG: hypothetical protein HOP37_10345 [Cyclobacteriaceae bacterium]|nr:hypothetical protein [Cyclobacteriaceae bacterium]
MSNIRFWEHWTNSEKRLFWLLACLALAGLSLFGYIYFQNPSLVYVYEQFQELKLMDVALRSFRVGLSTIEVPIENILLYETYVGSDLQPTFWIYHLFLGCLTIGVLLFLTFITTLKRYSFLGGIGFVILIIVNFHWEALLVFGLSNKALTIVVTILYAATAYYFQSFRSDFSFLFRLSCFVVITLIIAVVVYFGSRVNSPFLHLAVNGLTTGIIMSVVFIAMIAHELVALFVTIVTNSQKPTRSAGHFYLITAIYLANLVITYLIREKYLYWNIFTVDSFLLLTLSSIVGLWGVRKRVPLYADAVSSFPTVTYLYLGFFLTAYATLSFCFATHSTTMMEGFDDIILFMHLGYGVIFTAYVTANFGPMLLANVSVHKILYQPSAMPFFTFRTMGLIATFAFLSYSYPLTTYFDRAKATYYNAYGDMYLALADQQTAEAYYKKSIATRNRNHHAHYALANLYSAQLNPPAALAEYENIIRTTPSEMAYLNYGDAYQTNGKYVEAAALLKDGLRVFPTSGLLLNAQALNYYQLNQLDSSLLFFQRARKSQLTKDAAETNLFAASAQLRLSFPADSLLKLLGSKDLGTQSNAFALATLQHIDLPIDPKLPKDSLLNVRMATVISNQLTNQLEKLDTAALRNYVLIAKKPINSNFKEYVLQAAAHAYYEHGMVTEALELTRELAYSTDQGKYFYLIGIWLLEQKNPTTAALYFKAAEEKNMYGADFMQALAWTEADSLDVALSLWDSLLTSGDSSRRNQSLRYKKVMEVKNNEALQQDDEFIYEYSKIRVPLSDSLQFSQLIQNMTDVDLKTRAILERSKRWYKLDEPNRAISYLSMLKGVKLTDKALADEITIFNMMLAVETSNWSYLQKKMTGELPADYRIEKIYWRAVLAEREGRIKEAIRDFDYLRTANFQFEEPMLASARFFKKNSKDKLKSYSILVNGLLAKPNSVKLLKEYVLQARLLGFDNESLQAMTKLKKTLPLNVYQDFEKKLSK